MCLICGYVYYEMLGLPEEGIALGTAWEDIPDSWACPQCDGQGGLHDDPAVERTHS